MMNATVARIVDLMFENVEMNEETTAIRDELMNNCQERYADLVAAGMPEDAAVAAVVESLKGMEEVIAPYRRKAAPRVEEADDAENEDDEELERDLVFSPAEIHRIDVHLVNEDVRLEESDDGMYHVRWDAQKDPHIQVCAEDDTICITRLPNEWFGKDERTDDADEGVSSMMERLGRSLGRMFGGIRNAMSGGDGVTILIPHAAVPHVKLLTVSGDIDIRDVAMTELDVTTTSGDIDVDLPEDATLERLELRTTSGDIEVTACTAYASIATTSGDVEVNGRHTRLSIGTISGDIEVNADVKKMNFSAISGDVDLAFDSTDIQSVNGSTVSGDIEIDLPTGFGTMAIQTQTRSGDVTTRYATDDEGPTVSGGVSSMSGDITIR